MSQLFQPHDNLKAKNGRQYLVNKANLVHCCIVMPAWTVLLFYPNHFCWCVLPYVYYYSCNSTPQSRRPRE